MGLYCQTIAYWGGVSGPQSKGCEEGELSGLYVRNVVEYFTNNDCHRAGLHICIYMVLLAMDYLSHPSFPYFSTLAEPYNANFRPRTELVMRNVDNHQIMSSQLTYPKQGGYHSNT